MNAINRLAISGSAAAAVPKRFLAFRLGPLEYGLEERYVQTLLHYRSLTRVCDGGDVVQGVAIANGSIIPLVDMRIPFEAGQPRSELFAAVIILNLPGRVVGIVVDDVLDFVTLAVEQIGPLPPDCAELERDYLIGLGHTGQRSLILLDLDRLLCAAPSAAPEQQAA